MARVKYPSHYFVSGGSMPGKVRRIVTGLNAQGKSTIVSDSQLPLANVAPGERIRAGLWITESSPASSTAPDLVADGVTKSIPPTTRGGTIFRITDVPPDANNPHGAAALAASGVH